MYKLIGNLIRGGIMIGHSRFLMLICIVIGLQGCRLFEWDRFEGYNYQCILLNSTNDTLKFVFGSDTIVYTPEKFFIYPDSSYQYASFDLNDEEDPVRDGLYKERNRLTEQVRVYVDDSLVINWQGPPREMADTVHHIFNYNSWENILDKEEAMGYDGMVLFTIRESDYMDLSQ